VSVRSILVPTLVALGTTALYLPRLRDAPIYLSRDELFSALAAHSVSLTGRDPHGVFMPVFFQMDLLNRVGPMWFQPVLMYGITLAVKVLPFSEGTIRLPMAIAGVVDVLLVYFIAQLLFERDLFAVIASVLMALTPAHLIFSRLAMDFEMPLPFVLAWLLCLLMYLRRGDARALFAAGLFLGIGLYSYIAAMALMPMYAALSCVVLFLRRERLNRYGILAAGVMLPALVCVPFLMRHPAVVRDIALHYNGSTSQGSAALDIIRTLVRPDRVVSAMAAYRTFWNPRFLFIDGPGWVAPPTWRIGIFLLPIAGLLGVGIARALRRLRDPRSWLLVGGVLSAPIPASFVGEGEAIRRALELLPFAVLLAVSGLEYLWTETRRARSVAFLAIWASSVALAVASHDYVPHGQAYVRASTVPLAFVALTLLLDRWASCKGSDPLSNDRGSDPLFNIRIGALVAVVVLPAIQIAYLLGGASLVTVALAGAVAFGIFSPLDTAASRRTVPIAVVAVFALLSSELTYYYVDYSVPRPGFIPASAVLMIVRLAAAAVLFLAAAATAAYAGRRLNTAIVVTLSGLAFLQFAYFYIDLVDDGRMRFLQVSAVVVCAVGVATLLQTAAMRHLLFGPLTAVAVLGLAFLQFGYFYIDYHTGFQARASTAYEGNVAVAIETAIARAHDRVVPVIYVERVRGELGGGQVTGLAKLYATFYMMKAMREDLIPRTVDGEEFGPFDPQRIRQLPSGSVVIANPSIQTDSSIEQLTSAGELANGSLLKTPDGTPIYWVLDRTPLRR